MEQYNLFKSYMIAFDIVQLKLTRIANNQMIPLTHPDRIRVILSLLNLWPLFFINLIFKINVEYIYCNTTFITLRSIGYVITALLNISLTVLPLTPWANSVKETFEHLAFVDKHLPVPGNFKKIAKFSVNFSLGYLCWTFTVYLAIHIYLVTTMFGVLYVLGSLLEFVWTFTALLYLYFMSAVALMIVVRMRTINILLPLVAFNFKPSKYLPVDEFHRLLNVHPHVNRLKLKDLYDCHRRLTKSCQLVINSIGFPLLLMFVFGLLSTMYAFSCALLLESYIWTSGWITEPKIRDNFDAFQITASMGVMATSIMTTFFVAVAVLKLMKWQVDDGQLIAFQILLDDQRVSEENLSILNLMIDENVYNPIKYAVVNILDLDFSAGSTFVSILTTFFMITLQVYSNLGE